MSEFRLNGEVVTSLSLRFPLRGVWTADVIVDVDTAPTGAVTIEIAGEETTTLTGFARRPGTSELKTFVRVVGGAGGLWQQIDPLYYTDTTVRTVVEDLLRDAGETLSDTASSDVLDMQIEKWTRKQGVAQTALDMLSRSIGFTWRVLLDGTVWIGMDSFPEVDDFEHQVIREYPSDGRMEISADAFPKDLVPGVTFLERHVCFVEHSFSADRGKTLVYFEDSGGSRTDLAAQVQLLVDQATEKMRWFSVFPGKVSQQDDDETLQVELDDAAYPGLTKVPIRTFVPGASVKIAAEARVHVLFESGDPSKPCACLFDGATDKLLELTITTADGAVIKLVDGGDIEATPGSGGVVKLAGGDADVGRVGDKVKVKIPAGSFVTQVTGQAAGVLNPADVEVEGTIDAGAESVTA